MEVIRRMIALNPRQMKEQTRAFVTECPLPDYDALTQSPRLNALQPIPRQLSRPRTY